MSKKEKPEILNFGKEYAELFKKAIEETSKRTFISNDSITVYPDGKVEVMPTRASFLINLGMEYQKLVVTKEQKAK